MVRRTLALAAILGTASCEWISSSESFTREDAPRFKADTPHEEPFRGATSLRVMAWNIKYGACRVDFASDGWGERTQLAEPEVYGCLDGVAQLIRQYDADLLMVEAIDLDSKRSAYVDMVRYLLEHTQLGYAAYFERWNAQYVPAQALGRINTGSAILSRYPITRAERIHLPDPPSRDTYQALFDGHHVLGRAEVDVLDAGTVAVFVVEVSPDDADGTKGRQLLQVHDWLAAESLPWVAGGDFEQLPPVCDEGADAGAADACEGRLQLSGFPDEAPSLAPLPPYKPSELKAFFEDFQPSLTLSQYGVGRAAQVRYFTYTTLAPPPKPAAVDAGADGGLDGGVDADAGVADAGVDAGWWWNRTLDYLFIAQAADGGGWQDTDVIQAAGRPDFTIVADPTLLSDHAAVVGTWSFR